MNEDTSKDTHSHASQKEVHSCIFCKNNINFEIPENLIEKIIKGDVVIFAGAGISTEAKTVFPSTFYAECSYELGLDPEGDTSFPEMMSRYVKKFGRRKLLHEIKKRFDYVDSFKDLKWAASRFHKELSTIPYLRDIVTTNWDTLFEDETGAIPLVTPEDYAFWDLPARKVFKIHGSMSNIGTLIATAEDYKRCYRELEKGTLGASLKHMLATKTLVFIGYSFRDDDFKRIYQYIQKEMGDIIPQSFIVTTSSSRPQLIKNSTVIQTDGRYFIEKLKEELVKEELMLPDSRFEKLDELLFWVSQAHHELIDFDSFSKYPELIYTSAYQEGLLHALERIKTRRNTGEYSDLHHIHHTAHSYQRLHKGAVRMKKYFDASYIEGYLDGLLCLVIDDYVNEIPMFYLYGYGEDIDELKDLKALLGKGHTTKSALKKAEQTMKRQVGHLQPVHTPFLNGIEPI